MVLQYRAVEHEVRGPSGCDYEDYWKMEAAVCSETFACIYKRTWDVILEDSNLQTASIF
jgi:hypothetical protein